MASALLTEQVNWYTPHFFVCYWNLHDMKCVWKKHTCMHSYTTLDQTLPNGNERYKSLQTSSQFNKFSGQNYSFKI